MFPKQQILFFLLIASSGTVFSQVTMEKRTGEVTFKTSQNIYVKFENTNGIRTGDTLFLQTDNSPCIVVLYLSSRSCAGRAIVERDFAAGEEIYVFVRQEIDTSGESISKTDQKRRVSGTDSTSGFKKTNERFKLGDKPDFSGRFSVQSYSNLTNRGSRGDFQRWRYSFSMKADDIAGSGFSLSSYLIFNYRADDWKNVKSSIGRGIKVYDLGLSYKIDSTSRLWFGRHINRRIANAGSIDGIQYEKAFGNYFTGLAAGSRPNLSDLGFNLKLFEFGAYFGRSDTINNRLMESTLSFFQQTNNSKTDRRFLYLQHINAIIKNLNIYGSSEIDLYKKSRGTPENRLILTSLFVSGRFAPLKVLSVSISYDARKNVIYYETFKSFADSIFENETRQGLRGGINIKPFNNLYINFDAGYRFRKKDPKPSKNFSGRMTWFNVPFIAAAPSFSYSILSSSYMKGNIWGIAISKFFPENNISASLNYRETGYSFFNSSFKLHQKSVIANAGIMIIKKLYLNFSYEASFENKQSFIRFLTDLSLHF